MRKLQQRGCKAEQWVTAQIVPGEGPSLHPVKKRMVQPSRMGGSPARLRGNAKTAPLMIPNEQKNNQDFKCN